MANINRGAGIVSSSATAAAAVPGPHQPVAAGVALGATVVGVVAEGVQQIVKPDPKQFILEQLSIGVPAELLSQRYPLYAPVINEAADALKNLANKK